MTDPTPIGALAAVLEKAVDQTLRYDPGTRTALSQLAGKVIALEAQLPPLTIYLCPQPAGTEPALRVQTHFEGQVDTHLTGSLPAMLMLCLGDRSSLAGSGVRVSGDSGLLNRLQDILRHLDIDWEEPVTDVLGNTLGHSVAQLLRRQVGGLAELTKKTQAVAGEYITEELKAAPSREELEAFYDDVDALRSDLDRLSARFGLFQQHQRGD